MMDRKRKWFMSEPDEVWEAVASHRPYLPALGIGAALAEISTKFSMILEPISF